MKISHVLAVAALGFFAVQTYVGYVSVKDNASAPPDWYSKTLGTVDHVMGVPTPYVLGGLGAVAYFFGK